MKKLSTLLLTITFLLLSATPTTYAANWQWVGSSDTITYQIDTSSIKRDYLSGATYLKVWSKHIYNQEGVKQEIARLEKLNVPTDGYWNLRHSITRLEFKYNNQEKQWRSLSWADYDHDGQMLYSYISPTYGVAWEDIIPDSLVELYFNKAVRLAS